MPCPNPSARLCRYVGWAARRTPPTAVFRATRGASAEPRDLKRRGWLPKPRTRLGAPQLILLPRRIRRGAATPTLQRSPPLDSHEPDRAAAVRASLTGA